MLRARVLCFDLLLLSFVFFVLFEQYLFHLLFVFLLLLPLISLLAVLPVCFCVRCKSEIEDDIVAKGGYTVSLTVHNASILPCPLVRVRLSRRSLLGRDGETCVEAATEIVQLSLGGARRVTLHPIVQTETCGKVEIGVERVFVCDLMGLFALPVPKKNIDKGVSAAYILPALQTRAIRMDDAADLGLDSATYSLEKAGGDPSEVFRLRDYQEGDARHSVHWKLSARYQRLIVREFGLPLNPSLHFLIELRKGASPAAMEYVLGMALAFSEYLMARESTHRISWLDADQSLRTVIVSDADSLACALHELLALPAAGAWSTLARFALQSTDQPDTDLFYLVATADAALNVSERAERLITRLPELGVCRCVTLMPDRCTAAAAERLRALGCEVQSPSDERAFGEEEDA